MNEQIILPKGIKEYPDHVWYNKLFSVPECRELIGIGTRKPMEDGKIGNGIANEHVVDNSYRCVKTSWIDPHEAPWAFERLRDRVDWTNQAHYQFDLHGLFERLVFLRYDAPKEGQEAGHYNWHQDIGGGSSSLRKLSTVTQLCDGSAYEGGQLSIFTNGEHVLNYREPGDTVIFPSYTPHRVAPVTRGTRYALVAWVTGSPLR